MPSIECVRCKKLVPSTSKINQQSVSAAEARENGWASGEASDAEVIVTMCLQCQIDRAKDQHHPP